ncbi:glycosyltransferase family 2 protein [bacterium]|nr:glycosyltransferase family 2 protein [bacterium]MBU1634071.1 glycosyltransferase family 2 protein [bacterium]MBU1874504.1 glycosyltransferase family 2 protein [bacterium]
MQYDKVTVIVPCRNEEQFIPIFLDSIINQDYPQELMEIIVADGMSEDNTRHIIQKYIDRYLFITLIDNPKRIVSSALNLGIQKSTGEIIIRMDVHTEYADDYITQCVNILNQTGADNVGGPWIPSGKTYIQKAISIAFQSGFSSGGAGSHNPKYAGLVDSVYLGCWKKMTLEKIGFFDEELVRNQDDELNLRLIRSGRKIWQSPSIKSWYYPRSSISSLFKQYMQYGYWKVRVIQKHKIPAAIRHVIPGIFVGSLILLMILSLVGNIFLKFLIGLLSLYFLSTIGASIIACISLSRWKYIPIMPVIFAAYHFGYGYGFLRGVLNFVVLKKTADKSFTQLTRMQKDQELKK